MEALIRTEEEVSVTEEVTAEIGQGEEAEKNMTTLDTSTNLIEMTGPYIGTEPPEVM